MEKAHGPEVRHTVELLVRFPNLTALTLYNNDANSRALEQEQLELLLQMPFVKQQSLRFLNLTIRSPIKACTLKARSFVEQLYFGIRQATNETIEAVPQHVQSLKLSGAQLTDDAFASIARFSSLQVLLLGGLPGISDAGIAQLQPLQLQRLTIAYCRNIQGTTLTSLVNLQHLRLDVTGMSESIPTLLSLSQLPRLETLDISTDSADPSLETGSQQIQSQTHRTSGCS